MMLPIFVLWANVLAPVSTGIIATKVSPSLAKPPLMAMSHVLTVEIMTIISFNKQL